MRHLRTCLAVSALVTSLAVAGAADGAVLVRGVSTDAGFRWRPKTVSVATGTKVVWKAVEGSHTVTSYKGPWSKNTTIAPGATTSFTFRQAGTYRYRCLFHSTLASGACSGMCGKVVVG